MDEAGTRRVQAFIEQKWKQGECPICHTNQWQVGVEIAEMPVHPATSTLSSASLTYPLFPIFCNNCGYTLLFSAGIAGLLPPPIQLGVRDAAAQKATESSEIAEDPSSRVDDAG
jgi:hypothetical protein